MKSNDFVTALTKRRAVGTAAPALKDQCNASPTIRELLSTGPGMGMAAVIEPDGRLRMRFQPIYKKDTSGGLLNVLARRVFCAAHLYSRGALGTATPHI